MQLTDKDIKRFWKKVDVRGPGECWPWIAARKRGYGIIKIQKRCALAHRVSLMIHLGGDIGENCALHRCDNPPCCNPAHLWAGTNLENMRDMIAKGRDNKASGDRHSSRTMPWRVARGDRHGSRTHPECVPRGEDNKRAKLTEAQVLEIRARAANGETGAALAREFGVYHTLTCRIIRRGIWKHV